MKRPPTVETLFGAAAAIMVAVRWSGSVWGGTTSRAILLRLSPRTFDGVWRLESESVESYRSSAGGEFGRCFRPVAELVQHAVNGPEPHREHREQIWKLCQVITARPPCPIDIPGLGALGFNRNRGVCSGGVWCRPTSVRCCRGVMATLLSWPRFVAASVVCVRSSYRRSSRIPSFR